MVHGPFARSGTRRTAPSTSHRAKAILDWSIVLGVITLVWLVVPVRHP